MRKADREIKNFEEIVDVISRCDTIRQQSGLYVVPVIKGCLLGKR